MQVKRACRHTTHRQTDERHMKYKAARDEDDVSSSPLLKSLQQFLASGRQQFLASGRRLYTNTPVSITFENEHKVSTILSSSAWSRKGADCKTVLTTSFLFTRPQSSISHFPTASSLHASMSPSLLNSLQQLVM